MRHFTALIALFFLSAVRLLNRRALPATPAPGPVGGVLLTVAADAPGMMRVAQVAPGQDVPRDFVQQAMRAVPLAGPHRHFPGSPAC